MSVQLLPILDQIVALDEALRAQHGRPVYFPITKYGANRPAGQHQVRAAEAYFVKFPAELFDVISGIEAARIAGDLIGYPGVTKLSITPTDPGDRRVPARPPILSSPTCAHIRRAPHALTVCRSGRYTPRCSLCRCIATSSN
jgi:hypothetical protein